MHKKPRAIFLAAATAATLTDAEPAGDVAVYPSSRGTTENPAEVTPGVARIWSSAFL